MSSSSSTVASVVRTGFSRKEFESLKSAGDTQSTSFLAGSEALSKKTDVVETLTTKKRSFGGVRIGKSERREGDPLDPDVDTSITDEEAQGAFEASKRRELEIRRRLAAPGRDSLFLARQ